MRSTSKKSGYAPVRRRTRKVAPPASVRNLLNLAQRQGLLEGSRDTLVRGRMPRALVIKAKARTGVHSDTKLIELALVNLAVADDYTEWLLSQRGTIPQDIDLEF